MRLLKALEWALGMDAPAWLLLVAVVFMLSSLILFIGAVGILCAVTGSLLPALLVPIGLAAILVIAHRGMGE